MSQDVVRLSRRTTRILGIAAGLAASLIVLVVGEPSVIEAWLLGFILLAGVSAGALALLLTGHILGETWLQPIRAELEAIADLVPMVAVLALPILVYPEVLYRWADSGAMDPSHRVWLDTDFFIGRSVLYLAIWTAIASLAKRRHTSRMASAVGLVILIPAVSLAALDWLASREDWIPGFYGPAFAVSQLLAAMTLALLVTLIRPGHPHAGQVESLRTALLLLSLLTAWTWFTQFLIVWMADLPAEAAWYLGRAGTWLVLQAIAVPALLIATVLLVAPHAGPLRLLVICGLLLVQHFAHLVWLIRPAALHAVPAPVDVAVLAGLVGLWLVMLAVETSRRPNLAVQAQAGG